MSDYQGNIVIKNPTPPGGPAATGRAPGMWKLSEVAYWIKQGLWPDPNILPDQYFPYVSLLLSTTALGNANNNLFVDSSGAFNSLSRIGNPTQGSATPYSTNWSNYFDGSGDYFTVPYTTANFDWWTSGVDFTIEAWVFATNLSTWQYTDSAAGVNSVMVGNAAATSEVNYWSFGPLANGTVRFKYYNGANNFVTSTATITANTWNHVAMTKTSSGITVYVNGVAGTTTAISGTPQSSTGYPLIVGQINNATASGYISNLRVVRGTAIYSGNFTPPTAPLTAVTNTTLLTCQSNRFRDASTNNLTLTVTGNTSVQDFGPFSPAYPGLSYNQNDITNWSGYFDGNGDWIGVTSSNSAFGLGTSNFTIEMWVFPTANPANGPGTILDLRTGASASATAIRINSSLQLLFYNGPANNEFVTGTVRLNAWTHIAFVRSSGTLNTYINGTLSNTTTLTSDLGSSQPCYIGVNQTAGYNFNGNISNFRIVKGSAVYTSNFTPSTTPLTAISGTSLLTCQNAAFTDNSTNNFILTQTGNPTVTGNNPFQATGFWSNYFNSGSYLTVANSTPLNLSGSSYTIEMWINPFGDYGNYNTLVAKRVLNSSTTAWEVYLRISTGVLSFYNGTNYESSTTPTPGIWSHVAAVFDGTNINLYLNGTRVLQSAIANNDVSADIQIGTFSSYDERFIGNMSNLRITKGAALYTGASFTPPTGPLTTSVSSGTVSLLTCQSNRFIDNSVNAATVTPVGNPLVQPFDPFYSATISSNGGSLYFNGSSYLETPNTLANAIGSADCTIESWVQYTNPSANSDTPFFGNYTGAWTTNSVYWGKHTSYSGRVAFWVNNYSPSTALLVDTTLPTSSWHHYAVTRSGSTWRMFRDGVVVATASWSGSLTGTNGLFTPGRADILYFNGYMSDMRVVKGTAVYTSAFTPPTAPLTPTAGTVLLLNGMNAGVFDATTINDMETVGNAQVRYPWPFAPANYWAGAFDGNGDYLSVADNAANRLGTGDFTVEFWVYGNSWSNLPVILEFGRNAVNNSPGIEFYVSSSGGQLDVYGGATTGVVLGSYSNLPTSSWVHVALTRASGSNRLFINGVQSGATTTNSADYTQATMWIGSFVGGGNSLNGLISNLRVVRGTAVYTSNFTPPTSPLTAISGTSFLTCQNKTFIDNSPNALTITANGNATAGAIGPFTATGGTSVYFDGNGDYLAVPSTPNLVLGSGDFTIEFWLYLNSNSIVQVLYDQRNGNGAYPVIYMPDASIRYYVNTADRIIGANLNTATWYHIAVCRSGTSTRMFINGTQSGSTYTDTTNYLAAPLFLGADKGPGNFMNGYMDDLRVTKGVARYTSNFTPPTQPFPIY